MSHSGVLTAGRTLHGRLLQDKNQDYLLPADGPEMERLTKQHRALNLALNSLYWPIDDVRKTLAPTKDASVRILDIGSGSGVWAAAMAKEFPHSEVVGLDLSPMRPSDAPPNCRYEFVDVVLDDLSRFHGMFNVVHCRFVGGGVREYRPFLQKVVSMVKPGGMFLIAEGDLDLCGKNKQPAKRAQEGDEPGTSSWFARVCGEVGDRVQKWPESEYPPSLGWSTPGWLGADGRIVDVQSLKVYLPIGWPGADDNELENKEQVGRLAASFALDACGAFSPGLLAAGVSKQELDLWLRESEADILQTRVEIYMLAHYCAARAKA